MDVERRISATFKDLPGGQVLGPTFDYTHRLLDLALAARPPSSPPLATRAGGRDDAARHRDLLAADGLIEPAPPDDRRRPVGDLTREPLAFPADRDLRLQNLARGDEGFLLALGYSTQRGYGRTHPFAGEIRFGEVEVEFVAEEVGFAVPLGRIAVTECQMVNQFKGSASEPPQFTRGYGLVFGQSERKAMSMALVDRALRARELGEEVKAPAQDEEFVLSHSDNVQATGFVEHLKLPHYVDFQAELGLVRRLRAEFVAAPRAAGRHRGGRRMNAPAYNFAYLDEQTKRMIRRAILKAIAIPGYQVPFASREMPMPYGWGTGGVQVTAAILGPDDVLKVIDQGSDDTTNAVSIRKFFAKTAGVTTTTTTARGDASSRRATASPRRRSPRTRSWSTRCRSPSRCASSSRARPRRARMHALAEYGLMHVKLYEDIARHGHIATTYAYPVKVDGRYVMDPSPTPKFDNPKMNDCAGAAAVRRRPREAHLRHAALHAGGVARLRGPSVRALRWSTGPARCAARPTVYLDEVIIDDRGGRMFVCSDTDYCETRRGAPRAIAASATSLAPMDGRCAPRNDGA